MAQYDKLINLGLLSQFLTKAKTIFAPKITASGILKGDGSGNVSAATAGADYLAPSALTPYRTAAAQDVIDAGKEAAGLGLTGASVGDLVRVNAVDANGKPTSWKHVPLNEIKCNKNLLDNWCFVGGGSQLGDGVFPINQRGQTAYSGYSYVVDRWRSLSSKLVMTILSDYISIDLNGSGVPFCQKVNSTISLAGKTVTFSILAKGKNIRIAISAYNGASFSKHFVSESFAGDANAFKIYSVTAALENLLSTDSLAAQIYSTTNESSPILCKAVKLELGSEQTLCHNEGTEENPVWVLNEIPDYGEELRKCQRYFVRYSSTFGSNKPLHFICINENYVEGDIYLPEKMASLPKFTLNGVTVQRPNTSLLSVPNVTNSSTVSMYNNAYYMYINAPGVSVGDIGYLRLANSESSYIDISCEP